MILNQDKDDRHQKQELPPVKNIAVAIDINQDKDDRHPKPELPPVKNTPLAIEKRDPLEFIVIVSGATILSFNAGFVNAICILTHKFGVTHVTGSSSGMGIAFATADFEMSMVLLCLISSYCAGSCFVGVFLQSRTFSLGEEYGKIFIFGSLIWLAAFLSQWFFPLSFVSMYLCAFGSGLQNAMTSNYSGNVLRTSHMTGVVCDIGIIIGRMIQGKEGELYRLYLLVPIYIAFVIGGVLATIMHAELGEICLLFNFVFFLIVGVSYSVVVGMRYHLSCWTVLLGSYSKVELDVQSQFKFIKNMMGGMMKRKK